MIGIDLRPHQINCVGAVLKELDIHDRATLISPCGTGKTVIACRLAERLLPDVCVLLEPSLELVGQTLRVWKSLQPLSDQAVLVAVCSQDEVGADESTLDAGSDIEVTLDVARLLVLARNAKDSGRKLVIVGTYHSSELIAQAARAGMMVDFMVFDEAHRTAVNTRSGMFTACLSDENCPVKKRVFMTATPRHIASNDDANSFSMDNPEVYGRYAYVLSLADAIAQRLVTDYRVVVAAVHEDEISEHVLNLKNSSDTLAAAWAIALDKCVTELGVRKAITFHDTVANAKSFALSSEVQANWPVAVHVNGKMPMGERRGALRTFAESADNALTTNVRCLSEGLDVPAVDLVGFMSPRGSLIDVVQAVGRCMRVVEGKNVGYVLLPIMVSKEDDGDVKAALKRSDMRFIWEVLATLRDMSVPIHQKSVASSRARNIATDQEIEEARKHFKSSLLFLGSEQLKTDLREAIELVHVDGMRTEWEKSYLWIKDYNEKNGTFHLPYGSEENKLYGKFLANARLTYRLGKISERIKSLWNEIGFPWDGEAEKLRTQEMHRLAEKNRIAVAREAVQAEKAAQRVQTVEFTPAKVPGYESIEQFADRKADEIRASTIARQAAALERKRLKNAPADVTYSDLNINWVSEQLRASLQRNFGEEKCLHLDRHANGISQDYKTFAVCNCSDPNLDQELWAPKLDENKFRLFMDDELSGVSMSKEAWGLRSNSKPNRGLGLQLVQNVMAPLSRTISLVSSRDLPLAFKKLLVGAVGHEFLLSPAAIDVMREDHFTNGHSRFIEAQSLDRLSGDFKSLRECLIDYVTGAEVASSMSLSPAVQGWWFLSHRINAWEAQNGFGYLNSRAFLEAVIEDKEHWEQVGYLWEREQDEEQVEQPAIPCG